MVRLIHVILLFVLVDIAIATLIVNETDVQDKKQDNKSKNDIERLGARNFQPGPLNKLKKGRSTSSSSGEEKVKSDMSSDRKESIEVDDTSSSSSGAKKGKKALKPKSSKERRGWKKWHRKCIPCPQDMRLKWRDPRVKWICGSYQRARRSFKSLCMMHYRNCQDGTMFTKMADHKCRDATELVNHGQHFFYDYQVKLSDESSSKSKSAKSSSGESSSSAQASSSESWKSDKFGSRDMDSDRFQHQIQVMNNPD